MRQKLRMTRKLKPSPVLQNSLVNGRCTETGHLSGLGEPHRLFNRRDYPSRIAWVGTARMRGLGKINLTQPNVIWGRRRSLGLKQCHWNAGRQVPPIGKKNQWNITAQFFLRGQKYFNTNACRIFAGDGKRQTSGDILCQQSTCTKNEISKRQVSNLLGLKL